jgi:uncharacterized UBP type Zn finger protein
LCSKPEFFDQEINELLNLNINNRKEKKRGPLNIKLTYKNTELNINLFTLSNLPNYNRIIDELFQKIFEGLTNKQKFIDELMDTFREKLFQMQEEKKYRKESKKNPYFSDQKSISYMATIDNRLNNERNLITTIKSSHSDINNEKISKHRKFEEEKDPRNQYSFNTNIPGGLQNLGNTCYLNSIIQILRSLNSFRIILKNSPTSSSLSDLFNQMDSLQTVIPDKFINKIRTLNPIFCDNRPHDSKEFFVFLIKQLNDERINTDPIFAWISVKTLMFKCKHTLELNEKFLLITLPNGEFSSVTRSAFRKKTRTEGNTYPNFFCDKCNLEQQCYEKKEIVSSPKFVVFYREPNPRWIENLSIIQEFNIDDFHLKLRGIVLLHPLSYNMNHYTAIVVKENRWILYNDTSVSYYTSDQVTGGYLFFYQLSY